MAGLITLNVAFMPPRSEPVRISLASQQPEVKLTSPQFDLEATNKLTEQAIGYPIFAYWELFADPDGPRTGTQTPEQETQ